MFRRTLLKCRLPASVRVDCLAISAPLRRGQKYNLIKNSRLFASIRGSQKAQPNQICEISGLSSAPKSSTSAGKKIPDYGLCQT